MSYNPALTRLIQVHVYNKLTCFHVNNWLDWPDAR